MGFVIAILSILSSAGFLYYWGKSGYDWGSEEKDGDESNL
jgi:hypothetical protein